MLSVILVNDSLFVVVSGDSSQSRVFESVEFLCWLWTASHALLACHGQAPIAISVLITVLTIIAKVWMA